MICELMKKVPQLKRAISCCKLSLQYTAESKLSRLVSALLRTPSRNFINYSNKILTIASNILLTCSGLRPGGTQAYSSSTQPESSSEVELRWKPEVSLLTFCSIIKSRWRAPPWKPADTAALARLIRLSFY